MPTSKSNLVFAFEINHVRDIRETLQHASLDRLDFVVIPLFHPRFRRDSSSISNERLGPGTRSDRELECKDWISNVVGKISDWIQLDNTDSSLRKSSEEAFHKEMSWASHLGLQAVILPSPPIVSPNYSKCLLRHIKSSSYQQLWIRIPYSQSLTFANVNSGHGHIIDGWTAWNNLRTMTGHIHNLQIALEFSTENPATIDLDLARKWSAEPVRAVVIPVSMFITNKQGFPVLSKPHQALLSTFLQFKIQIIFKGVPRHSQPTPSAPEASSLREAQGNSTSSSLKSYTLYSQYMAHLYMKLQASKHSENSGIQEYKDRLQYPLQPLMDNLESQTYETFERDSVKYSQYELAIVKALTLLRQQCGLAADPTAPVVVTVVGAGRGPLVAAALSAAATTGETVKIYAIEKNENAIITLRNRVYTEKWTNVTVVHSDMREWTPPELASIMVSELLGSWGDNELSPECLDGAQKCLLPHIGVSIPTRYVSFLAPVSAVRLWTGVRDMSNGKENTYLNSPFVVKLHNFCQLDTSKPLFEFHHPNYDSPSTLIDNSRYAYQYFLEWWFRLLCLM